MVRLSGGGPLGGAAEDADEQRHQELLSDEARLRRATLPALDANGVIDVKDSLVRVREALADVDQHLKEGVTGIGLECALDDLRNASRQARFTYLDRQSEGPRARAGQRPASGGTG